MNDTVIKTEELINLKKKAEKWDHLMETVGSAPFNEDSRKNLGELVVNMFFCEDEDEEVGELLGYLTKINNM